MQTHKDRSRGVAIMDQGSPLSDFYAHEKFNPTFIDLDTTGKFRNHCLKRLNLYVNKLKIPARAFNNAKCLEFGCSSGENSLVLAKLGASFTFVEPQEQPLKRLVDLFQQHGVADKIDYIHKKIIETYENTDQKFDFVIAEGFLHYVPTRDRQLTKILKMVIPGGHCLIATADPYGQFVQLLKVFLFRYLQNREALSDDQAKMGLAWELFGNEFRNIPHSRPFEMYIKDTFYNPYVGRSKYWGLEAIIPVLNKSGFVLYSSWPYYGHDDSLLWHKYVVDGQSMNNDALKRYRLKAPSFIAGEELSFHDAKWSACFLQNVLNFMGAVEDSIDSNFNNIPDEKNLVEVMELVNHLYPQSKTNILFQETIMLFQSLKQDAHDIIRQYNQSGIPGYWGVPYHYHCFTQDICFLLN